MENQTIESVAKSEKLDEVITSSGLQLEEANQVKENYLPFLERLAKVREESKKINKENPTTTDEVIARKLRLETVDIRNRCGDVKDARKKIHLLKGNLEQAAYNLIKADCELIEEAFTQVEKARQIAEAKRKAELKEERIKLLADYSEVVSVEFIDLANMDEDSFKRLLDTSKISLQTKRDAEAKQEAERLAAIEAERKRIEDQRIENERLKKEAEEKERQLEAERKKARDEWDRFQKEKYDYLISVGWLLCNDDNYIEESQHKFSNGSHSVSKKELEDYHSMESLKKQIDFIHKSIEADAERKLAEEAAKKLQAEADAKLKAEQEKARKEKEKADAKQKKLELEIKAIEDAKTAEVLAALEVEMKKADEAKKLAKAGDKAMLKAWVSRFQIASFEGKLKPESEQIYKEITDKFHSFTNWANDKIDTL